MPPSRRKPIANANSRIGFTCHCDRQRAARTDETAKFIGII
jgi:hypothetical protein